MILAAPGVDVCKKTDPNVAECINENMAKCMVAFKNGYRSLGIPPLDPYEIEKLELERTGSGSISIQQKFRNLKMYGLTESYTKDFKVDFEKCEWSFIGISPEVRMEADYELTGQLLLFPINGHGKCNVTLHNVENTHTLYCDRFTKKNKKYLRVTKFTMDIRPGGVNYEFDNILPGNEQISKEISNTINENGLQIFNDIKTGYEEIFSQIYMNGANSVFSRIPENELFLD